MEIMSSRPWLRECGYRCPTEPACLFVCMFSASQPCYSACGLCRMSVATACNGKAREGRGGGREYGSGHLANYTLPHTTPPPPRATAACWQALKGERRRRGARKSLSLSSVAWEVESATLRHPLCPTSCPHFGRDDQLPAPADDGGGNPALSIADPRQSVRTPFRNFSSSLPTYVIFCARQEAAGSERAPRAALTAAAFRPKSLTLQPD